MKLKLADWASVAEIVAGLAVVITLIVLIVGVRENTKITRTAMYASTLDQFNAFETEMLLDSELQPLYVRYLNSDTVGLEWPDRQRVGIMVAITFRTLDRAFAANQNRQLGDEEWVRLERSLCTNYRRAESFGHLSIVEFLTTESFLDFAVSTCTEFNAPVPSVEGDAR